MKRREIPFPGGESALQALMIRVEARIVSETYDDDDEEHLRVVAGARGVPIHEGERAESLLQRIRDMVAGPEASSAAA